MPRIAPLSRDAAPSAAAAQLDATKAAFGGVPNMFATAAHAPVALEALLAQFSILGRSSLGGKLGEQVALTVAQQNDCGYCLAAHSAIGKMHGLDAATLQAARRAQAADPRQQAILTLARAIVERRGAITDAEFAAARAAGVTDGEIVEVVAHVSLNVFTNYLNRLAQTAVDFPAIPADAAA